MKILKGVIKVVGIIATIASFIPGPWQPLAATIAAIAAVASAALEIVSPTKASPNARGSPTQYQLDPNIGIPYLVGRTQFAGCCVKRETWGEDNKYQCFTSVYSLGPINAVEAFQADRTTINFAGGAATGALAGFMWFVSQVGLLPSPVLATPVAGLPGWTASSKMSGLAASHWVIKFDKKGKKFTGGPPQPGVIVQGVKVYDPRLDSTFPGGVGACRAGDESTYVYSETPHLHALTYALGRYQNGKRRFGIGFPTNAVDLNYFANAANVDEANGWKIGGLVYSTDNKWNTLKMMMEAGGGAPITTGGRLTGIQRAPKSSIITIGQEEVVGPCSVVAVQTIRDRINYGTPRYRSEPHGWEYVSADPAIVPAYVAADGGERRREYEWTLVQQVKQATQLTFYELYDAREMGPIELRLKLRWVGLKPGDCVTLNLPDMNLNNQKAVVIQRSFDPETGAVTLRFRTETDQKHTDALAADGAAPPIQSLSFDPDFTPPAPTGWSLGSGGLATSGGTVPTLRFTGPATLAANAEAVEFQYRRTVDADWSVGGRGGPDTVRFDVSSVAPGTAYMGRVVYIVNGKTSDPLDLGPFTVESLTASGATIANSIVGQGALATQNSADWLTQVTGGSRPADNAGATITLVANDASITIRGNIFTKTAASWRSGYVLQPLIGSGIVQFRGSVADAGVWMAGFTDTPTAAIAASADVEANLDFGIYKYGAGDVRGYAQGSGYGTTYPDVADDNTLFTIIYNGVQAKAYYGTTLMQTWNTTPGRTLYFAFYPFSINSQLREISVRPFGAATDLNSNVYDLAGASPYVTVPRNETRTPLGISAGFAGQGAVATQNSLAYGGAYLTGFGSIAARNNVRIATELVRADGSTATSEAMLITSLGQAASFLGQGALAVRNAVTAQQIPPIEPANLVIDPTFLDYADATVPSYSKVNTTVTPVVVTGTAANTAMQSSRALKFLSAGQAASGAPSIRQASASNLQVYAGETYRVRLNTYVEAGFNGQLSAGFFMYDNANTFIGTRTVNGIDYRSAPAGASAAAIITGIVAAIPSTVAYIQPWMQCSWPAVPAANAYVAQPEVKKVYRFNDLVTREDGIAVVTDALAITSLGNSAGFTGQGALATLSSLAYGGAYLTGFGTLAARSNARIGTELVRADGTTATSEAMLITTMGTAAAIAGQTAWATEATLTPSLVTNRTQRLDDTTGRIKSVAGYRANRSYGLRSVWTGVTFTDTWVGTNNVTINIPASTLTADDGTALSLPSGSLTGCTSATKFYIYRTLTDPLSATGAYGKATTLAGAMGNDNTYMGYWTTRATSGGTGGGGGGGLGDCVACEAFIPAELSEVIAELVQEGIPIKCLKSHDKLDTEFVKVERNHRAMAACVTLVSESGIRLTVASNTPLELADMQTILAPNGKGVRIPFEDENGIREEEVVEVVYAGERYVSHISVGGRVFAAGDEPGRYAYTHNQVKP